MNSIAEQMKELTDLLKMVEVNVDTGFGIITLQYANPIRRLGYIDTNIIDLYKKILELKNK